MEVTGPGASHSSSMRYDIAVVGAGPGGSAAAITAARLGATVVLIESGEFPRQKVCGEFVSAESLDVLRDLLRTIPEAEPRTARCACDRPGPSLSGWQGNQHTRPSTGTQHPALRTRSVVVARGSAGRCSRNLQLRGSRDRRQWTVPPRHGDRRSPCCVRDRRRRTLVAIPARHSDSRRSQVDRPKGALSRATSLHVPPTSTSSIAATAAFNLWRTTSSTPVPWFAPTGPLRWTKCSSSIPPWPNAAVTGSRSRSRSPRRRSSIARLNRYGET